MQETTYTDRKKTLLRDFGYTFDAGILVDKGVPGFISPRIVGRFQCITAAVEHLIPIILDHEFTERAHHGNEN